MLRLHMRHGRADEASKLVYCSVEESIVRQQVGFLLYSPQSQFDLTLTVTCGEAALTILLHRAKLPSLGQEGGILTSITALGEPYLQRLLDSELVSYDSEVVGNGRSAH